MITSKEILEQVGISRATLNNYIKLGILPRPIVTSPGSDDKGVKQIGYFPVQALKRIKKVQSLKRQGKTMDEIASLFQDKDWVQALDDTREKTVLGSQQPSVGRAKQSDRRNVDNDELHVTIEKLSSAAYLVNNNLEIEWINDTAEEQIFQSEVRSLINIEDRNVFKLLLSSSFGDNVKNWHELVELHCTLLQRNMDSKDLDTLFAGITSDQANLLQKGIEKRQLPPIDNLYRLPCSIIDAESGSSKNYLIHSESYREGVFIVFISDDQESSAVFDLLSQRRQIITELLNNRLASMLPLCTMVASLQNHERICGELLPTAYFQLINDFWQAVTPVFEKYYGTFGNHGGNEILYYFLKRHNAAHIINSISCAIELKEIAHNLTVKWQCESTLRSPLKLNIGIHEGREFFGIVRAGGHVEFTAIGNSAKVARRLSEFGVDGEIWVTKDLIANLPAADRENFAFGIYREQAEGKILQRDCFSLAEDLISEGTADRRALETISGLAITEITERRVEL